MNKELQKTVDMLNKRFGAGTITVASKAKALEIKRVSTGSLSIDIALGGGIPLGRVTLIIGPFSSGKSALVEKICAEAQKILKKIAEETETPQMPIGWIDAEGTQDQEWSRILGNNPEHLLVARPESGEHALDIADAMLRSGVPLVVLDSIAACIPQKEIDDEMEKIQVGNHAKMMNKFLRKATSAMNMATKNGVGSAFPPTLILINQHRQKIGVMYGDPTTVPGGLGQEYAASVILDLKNGGWIRVKENLHGRVEERVVGQQVKVYTKKNKTAPPKKEGITDFYFDKTEMFDKGSWDFVGDALRLGIQYGFIIGGGGGYWTITYNNDRVRGQEELRAYLQENLDIVQKIREDVLRVAMKGGAVVKDEVSEMDGRGKDEQGIIAEAGEESV